MVISKKEWEAVENMSDFVELIETKLRKVVDIDETNKVEILFVEKIDKQWKFIVHSKDKCSLDLEGKDILIFLIENPEPAKKQIEVQTESFPIFQYQFDAQNQKQMPGTCKLCKSNVLITDEYIRLLDCNHIYHRICLIHFIAELTSKRFFLTRKEQKSIKD